ncbi:MAG TPA: DUF2188 domain-containing protein [Casimicrobiaceae bacterium]|nr:DUF2188 domain-containing protein [Casimicrobiaceae bacterium]
MNAAIFEVRRNNNGDWNVFERGLDFSLETFAEKHAAIEFASAMARMRPPAEIRVVAADGTLLGARLVDVETVGVWD